MKIIVNIGDKFNRLTVSGVSHKDGSGHTYYECICDCGERTVVLKYNLAGGKQGSCGCYMLDRVTTHGKSNERIYSIWRNMKTRCTLSSRPAYDFYQGRLCDRWQSFDSFYEDVGEPPSNSHSIDRIDNAGNYEPGNVRWATPKVQMRNRRNTVYLEYKGIRKPLYDWADELGVSPRVLSSRIRNGWTVERAVGTPFKKHTK